jgi:class 3 adenylate cyclase/pimeloyl-ACP methyl ester carboxylesterase
MRIAERATVFVPGGGRDVMLTRYVTSFDGTQIAVGTRGDEDQPALMLVAPWASPGTETISGLASASLTYMRRRLVVSYDRRGLGESTRDVADFGIEAQVRDLAAVADALDLETFDVLAHFDGTPIAIAYAARCPERVKRMVLWEPFVSGANWVPPERVRGLIDLARTDWALALRALVTVWIPNETTETQRRLMRALRERITPAGLIRSLESVQAANVEAEARRVRAETLILHPTDAGLPGRHSRAVAALISGSVLRTVEGLTFPAGVEVPEMILQFLEGERDVTRSQAQVAAPAPAAASASTAIIMFADVVDSTALTERLGDAGFRAKARELDDALRATVREHGGGAIDGKLLGDGILATFPAASGAIGAALALEDAAQSVELELHVGLHAGDVIREEENVYGGAVNVASRICALSAPGEVLVSDLVRGLARTSAAVAFEDRGERELKGIGEPVRVYAVRGREASDTAAAAEERVGDTG